MFGTALMGRLTLLINHVLTAEPEATKRLTPHAGRCIELQPTGWPPMLPRLPRLAFLVTPAGLVEWLPDGPFAAADLVVAVDASNPARLAARGLAGNRPAVEVAGDAQFAADVSWLMDNLRWDVADDLARIVGDGPARELARIGEMVAEGVRRAISTLSGLVSRARPGTGTAGDASPR
jgi:ubiquinone biosynthesis protein UbiJ